MAMDGSFSLESEFKRLLARCPKLASNSRFILLSQLGQKLSEEEVVNTLGELFIHPNYTIQLIGCFRPIVQKIIARAVHLLRFVPDLISNSKNIPPELKNDGFSGNAEELKDEVVNVIDFYSSCGSGLILHDLACLAFSRTLDLAPFLLGSILSYFKFAPSPFECIYKIRCGSDLSAQALIGILNSVRTSYTLLLHEPGIFSKLWDWSCFMSLLRVCRSVKTDFYTEHLENFSDISWYAIRIVFIILKMGEGATKRLGREAEDDMASYLRLWDKFCRDVSLEKAGWYIGPSQPNVSFSLNGNINFSCEPFVESFYTNVITESSSRISGMDPSIRTKILSTCYRRKNLVCDPFVLTSNIKKSFEMVELAVSQKWPILLYGIAGAGKTALINMLAMSSGNRVLSVHMDDQMDSKTLVGGYVCMEKPGEFKWQPGSLTLAVMNGFWVVFEDVDRAPSDVQSILLPLLEGAVSFITGHGEAIPVADGFRLFSTISSSKIDVSHNGGGCSLSFLWRRVLIPPPSKKDLVGIVKAWYPNLEPIIERLIETFESVNCASIQQHAAFCLEKYDSFCALCRFSLRDLLKWCKRINSLCFVFGDDGLSSYICNCIYQEATDVFAAYSTSSEKRFTIMKGIAKLWIPWTFIEESLYPPKIPLCQSSISELTVGRISLERFPMPQVQLKPFVSIRSSLHILERIACSVKYNEPVLLVGETGTGKTTLVQNLASRLGRKITVMNLSQQSDVADLLGGFRPTNARSLCIPLYNEFIDLLSKSSLKCSSDSLRYLNAQLMGKNWKSFLRGFQKARVSFQQRFSGLCGEKRKKIPHDKFVAWEKFFVKLETVHSQIGNSFGLMFSFEEGAFITALRHGNWVLLDEINLAPPETLQRIIGVLDGENSSICLTERGDDDYIHRHPNFRIFACMNPPTDVGKRDLPYSLRSRFTEYFIEDVLDDNDLFLFINEFIGDIIPKQDLVNKILQFYREAKKLSGEKLQDGANQSPQYSLRSLYRALEYTRKANRKFGFMKALYDGFSMFFLNLLDQPSAKLMNGALYSLLERNIPSDVPYGNYLMTMCSDLSENYVLTRSVMGHLKNLAQTIFIKRYPVLLQGPTSSGKTSLVQYLAAVTGRECVRINNHAHTDLQEYLGSYLTDASGKLEFHEGVLVKAVRNGYWIILDELNLAPSDVLEALNRLLDDNRELFVPELSETILAHPEFMLFATQNPPNLYVGRKMLSRAFRNRFVEIHIDEIPEVELSTILEKRCKIPESNAKKMVAIMKDLHKQRTKALAGKHGFITPRDLFRWANRLKASGNTKMDLAWNGYLLLAERLRDESEKSIVKEILEKHLRVKICMDYLGNQVSDRVDLLSKASRNFGVASSLGNIILTRSMQRLYYLIERCYELQEPVLLVGETGGGKTTVCQILSLVLGSKLHILNCHQHTETSDFLGGFYPIRDRSHLTLEFKSLIDQLLQSKPYIHFNRDVQDVIFSPDIGQASSTLHLLSSIIDHYRNGLVSYSDVTEVDLNDFEKMKAGIAELSQKWQTIFTWQDGPLLQAMRDGDLFLLDEISLADDSVLERLNSVLEPERKLTLAEKGGYDLEQVAAHSKFFLLATMNPSGDYGKKELSPALRNRFTEIWVPPVTDHDELRTIALKRFSSTKLHFIVDPMLNFWRWFNQSQVGRKLTVRDLLSWVDFIIMSEKSLQPKCALLHGLFLVLLDGLTLGTGLSKDGAAQIREKCFSFLLQQLNESDNFCIPDADISKLESYGWGDPGMVENISCSGYLNHENLFGINPFYIEKGDANYVNKEYEFLAPTTRRNALRLLRAMQLSKPVLLEGSPGVGKTSLIVALGKLSGHRVVRINLSEQSDMMDLLGSDLPVESDEGLKFAWSDGVLLQALRNGYWVLLDELNLAPQSVLEGLNAILDHRSEVFIPELNRTFQCPLSFRVFACQNPASQGGGRKCLPSSFLNRFIKVFVDELVEDDYFYICSSLYPTISNPLLSKLILFNKQLCKDTMLYHKFARDGSPWEFNLRDVIRACQLIQDAPANMKESCFLNVIYLQRMRTPADRCEVLKLFEHVFGVKPFLNPYPRVHLNPHYSFFGSTIIKRSIHQSHKVLNSQLKILPAMRHTLEAAAQCVQFQWLCILIGPVACGKTSLIKLLAHLTGNALNELNLSSTTDVSEILGCFEQYNLFRSFRSIVAEIERYVNEFCRLCLESSMDVFINEKSYLIGKWLAFLSSLESVNLLSSVSTFAEHPKTALNSLNVLAEIIELLELDLERNMLPVSWSLNELRKSSKMIVRIQENCRCSPSEKFEWVSGLLLKAIENGDWIVLENANMCNPTVLDRINSLVEPCGSIMINECGIVDGEPVVLHPHPNFRMFLTVNPAYGEVSRSMRNRGVEIFMMLPYWLLEKGNAKGKNIELEDVKRFLVLSGIPIGKLVDLMAMAHIYARDEGKKLNVRITFLDLSRWVQLFQQLLVYGNQPLWSLWTSWEHTYTSSFSESEGFRIIACAKDSFLSYDQFPNLDWSTSLSSCLPGGWPMPIKLMDFICYSKEATIKQNCMYLECLGAQCAAYEFITASGKWPVDNILLSKSPYKTTSYVSMRILQSLMFPNPSKSLTSDFNEGNEFDLAFVNRKLFFAASWVIEQVIETDLKLYLIWFSWMDSQMQPFCHFFSSFLALLNLEFKHSIWICIFQCRHQLLSRHQVDLDMHPIPMLSSELLNICASDDFSELPRKYLSNAIKCIDLLRISFQQWDAENRHDYDIRTQCFASILRSLRCLEENLLDMLVESPHFDAMFKLCNDLFSNHVLFWNSMVSNQIEYLLLSWRTLIKTSTKLLYFCPGSVKIFLLECKSFEEALSWSTSFDEASSWRLNTQKPLLWVYAGHPFVPSSSDLFYKQHQLLNHCESIWPSRANSWNHDTQISTKYESFIEVVVSSDLEIRSIVVQGLQHIEQHDEDNANIIHQLEDRFQTLLRRYEHEKEEDISGWEDSAACCIFSPELLCRKPGFLSWQEMLPIVDCASFFMDMDLLKELAVALVGADELQLALSSIAEPLEVAFNFSLKHSSRPPTDFLPHNMISRTLVSLSSVGAASAKIASFVLELWFKWHSFLWTHHFVSVKECSMFNSCDMALPSVLFQPLKMAVVRQIMQSTFTVKEYPLHCLKLRTSAHSLWDSPLSGTCIRTFLLSSSRSLFRQKEKIEDLCLLIASSRHRKLASSLKLFIEPVLKQLFLQCSSTVDLYDLGQAWLHIGGFRLYLLFSCDGLDPVMKNSLNFSQLQERKSLLELQIKIRQELEYLVGWSSTRESDELRTESLKNFEFELKNMKQKVVFRPDPWKFKKLKYECDEFLDRVSSFIKMMNTAVRQDTQQRISQICNWQETATCFINRLSDEYNSYIDIIQPVQVAIYETKLGSSLIQSTFQNEILHKADQDKRNQEMMYSFMRFPRSTTKPMFVDINNISAHFPYCSISFSLNVCDPDTSLLEKLVTVTNDVTADKTYNVVTVLQQKAAINQNILVRLAHFVANAKLLDRPSFLLMDKIFHSFLNIWMDMKVQTKTTEDFDAQQYKFRPRFFKIYNIFSNVESSSIESPSEWPEIFSMGEFIEEEEASESKPMDDEWNQVLDSFSKNMVHTHNQLFGSVNLSVSPGIINVSDIDVKHSFIESYTLGTVMIKGLGGLLPSLLDDMLVPEHLLRLCLEHDHISNSHLMTHSKNFYKVSNAPVLVSMVKVLTALKQRIIFLLGSGKDHPDLNYILDLIEMLFSLPLTTPLSKALSGLQFLHGRACVLQDNGSEFSLSEQLEPILVLISSWQKMEFDSWSALLDEVHDQYEISAGKLWFPLYSVIQSDDIAEYCESTVNSLMDFIKKSSIGEFKKRLELLFAFHGQVKSGICLGLYSNSSQMASLKILYNVFGFYVQFLPRILEYISTNRREIEKELKEHLQLCHWDSLSIEVVNKARRKLRKLVQKYNVLLQENVMSILNYNKVEKGVENQCFHDMKVPANFPCKVEDMPNVAFDLIQRREKHRYSWYVEWKKKADISLQKFFLEFSEFFFSNISIRNCEGDVRFIIQDFASHDACNVYIEEWKPLWCVLEKLCETVMDCYNLWEDGNKCQGKRRALSDLLKLLEISGLSKHNSMFLEDQLRSNWSNKWFVQPSYDVEHLLPTLDVHISASIHSCDMLDAEWKTSNQYYFKSLDSVWFLNNICSNFHKDFTLDQVSCSLCFLNHLVVIQQEQRAAIYKFDGVLRQLKKCLSSLDNLWCESEEFFCKSSVTQNQHVTYKCMWHQKQLFDSWCAIFRDESFLLSVLESTHLDTCINVKDEAKRALNFIEKFIPVFRESKALLDNYLLDYGKIMTAGDGCFLPCLISNQMEMLLFQNIQVMNDFEEELSTFRDQNVNKKSVQGVLFAHFDALIEQGKQISEDLNSMGKSISNESLEVAKFCDENGSKIETIFSASLQRLWELMIDAFQKLGSSHWFSARSEKVTSWKPIFEFCSSNLQLDSIYNELLKTLYYARELVNHSEGINAGLCVQVEGRFRRLNVAFDLLLRYSQSLLCDSLALNKTVSILTTSLANIFSSLYSKGFGTTVEDVDNESVQENCQDAKGTGMGEGSGANDVSDQINDEDQLCGASEKLRDNEDDASKVPSNADKGIEMEQDFDADTFSVSEESTDGDDDKEEDEELEKAMGSTGAESEVVDEKFSDKNDEDGKSDDNGNDKYESGPPVDNEDLQCREMRAKEDQADDDDDESEELKPKESENGDDKNGGDDGFDDMQNVEDKILNKEDVHMDSTGLKPGEVTNDIEENIDMGSEENEEASMEGVDSGNDDDSYENKNGECEISSMEDEAVEDGQVRKTGDDIEMDVEKNDEENIKESLTSRENAHELENYDINNNYELNPSCATDTKSDLWPVDLRNTITENKWPNTSNMKTDLAPSSATLNLEIMFGNSGSGAFSDNLQKSQFPLSDSSPVHQNQANPFRNVGDVLKDLKERVNVSMDFLENGNEDVDDLCNENADEYGYTTHKFDKGTDQVLGPATTDQSCGNINDRDPDEDVHDGHKERNSSDIEVGKLSSEINPLKSCTMKSRDKVEERTVISEVEDKPTSEGSPEARCSGDLSESVVSIKKNFMSEDFTEISELCSPISSEKKIANASDVPDDDASMKWKKYESLTTRLSQELAEQLRLVMEPTQASKLQGDYKTGKRINMKKVIPYIASHYRKDKIWMRRTRPNKRDYQVVIAVDDSLSMSVNKCGVAAVESLVAVWRAMSLLEVGKLAVASFGREGNIQLLHDFDDPFSAEAGAKVISSFKFNEDVHHTYEPTIDLLNYLNNKLDAAAANARLPSGHNPLHQIVLIISDGVLHDAREPLRRALRHALNRNCMVVYLLLDDPQDPFMDRMRMSIEGNEQKVTKCLDTFPFPYYILLRNIEDLPRTLANALKEWFEAVVGNS